MGRDYSCPKCGHGGMNDPDGYCICLRHIRVPIPIERAPDSHFTVPVDLRRDEAERIAEMVRAFSTASEEDSSE
jgi:hypothetical protein